MAGAIGETDVADDQIEGLNRNKVQRAGD